ncbi:MAG: DUF2325 domain-containing protein [Polyangiaceae bacterium]|nr:DUF2325 domain-containing protein [Polyangiaceae bacterium]
MREPAQLPASRARPRIAFVGGAQRIASGLVALSNEVDADIEVHDGHTDGNGAARLAALVQRTQLIVLIVGINSHNAVHVVKREAARWNVPIRILRSCGVGTARALLTDVLRANGA